MAQPKKTSKKRPAKPFKGAVDGIPFTKDNQPTPEAKSKGWEQWRSERHLTQAIIKHLAKGNNFNEYINSLVENAKKGIPKAIDTINNGIEEQVTKIDHSTKGEKITGFNFIVPDATGHKADS